MSEDSANRLQKGLDLVTSSARKRFSWTLDNMLYYNRSFDKHSVNLTFLQEAMYNMNTQLYSMQGYGIALGKVGMAMTQKWWGLNGSSYTRDGEPSFNSLEESQLASYMVRGSYSYDNRYLLTLSYRYDGASQLGSGRKWQGFPSVALGWRLDQESFLKDVSWISELKLRAGWGKTGNYSVGLYSTKDNLTSAVLSFGSEGSTVYYTPNSFANQSITWETTDQYNIGVDFSVLRGRISGVLDLYKNYTNGLIFPVTLPSASGKTSTNANVGKTENHGFDFTVNTTNISTRDFSWKSSLNLDFNTSKIVELQNGKQDTSRSGIYHNKVFKDTAEAHGLNVEHIDKAGWCRTSCTEQLMQWIDDNVTFSALHLYKKRVDPSEGKESKPKQSTRKYVCPCCGLIVRATKDCRISCMDCDEEMKLES